jgi:hypothetical protein
MVLACHPQAIKAGVQGAQPHAEGAWGSPSPRLLFLGVGAEQRDSDAQQVWQGSHRYLIFTGVIGGEGKCVALICDRRAHLFHAA